MFRARQALAAAAATLAALAAAGCGGEPTGGYSGQVLPSAPPAPDFSLRSASGKTVSLRQYRGRAVLLTFVYTRCPDVCPLIMTNLGVAIDKLPAGARRPQILAVSVDPEGDTPAQVRRFLRVRGLSGRAEYLIGSERELAPVWKAYGVAVQATPEEREVGHTATVVGITARGRRKTIYPQNFSPTVVARDVPLLAKE